MLPAALKKIVTLILIGTNLSYPLKATADTYGYRASVNELKVSSSNDGSGGSGSQVPAAVLSPTPSNQSFGSVVVGQASSVLSVSFTNTGTLPAQTGTASPSAEYSVSNECNSVMLAPGQACTVQVRFTPVSVKNFAPGSVTLSYSFEGSTGTPLAQANFTAIGAPVPIQYAPQLIVSASTVNFGNVVLGQTSSRSVVLTNAGNLSASLTYSDLPAAVLGGGTCTSVLAAGESCTLELAFSPTQPSTTSSVLLINANEGASFASVSLNGTGAHSFSFEPSATSLSFAPGGPDSQSLSLLNTGTGELSAAAISVEGPGLSAAHSCTIVPAGQSCTVTVTRTSSAPGTITGAVHASFAGTSVLDIPVVSSTVGSVLAVTPSASQDFGNVVVGNSSGALTYFITNTGNEAAALLVGTPSHATVSQGGTCTGVLGAAQSCQLTLTFSPTSHGAVSGVITLEDSAPNRDFAGSLVLGYAGFGQGVPLLQAAMPGGGVFVPVAVGASVTKTLSLTNPGTLALSGLEITKTGSTAFAVSSQCADTLAPGATCTAEVVFTARGIGQDGAVLNVTSASGPSSSIPIYGTGQSVALSVDADTQTFGNVDIGTSVTRTYTLTNSGNISGAVIVGGVSAPVTQAGTCSGSLAAGASCTVTLTYAPTDTATLNTSLNVSVGDQSVTMFYSGTGVAIPSMTVSTYNLMLGNVATGANAAASVSVYNAGNVPLTAPVVSSTGAAFSVTHNCPATLAVGASCQATAAFAPTAPMTYNGSVSVAYSAAPAQTILLSGTGQAAVLSADAPIQAFGSVALGSTTSLITTLTNNGNISAALNYSAVSAPFSRSGTCSPALAAGASCTVVLTYTPTAAITSSGALTVSATGTSTSVSYSGTGQANPTFSLSISSLAFGSVMLPSSSSQVVTITNTGNVPLSSFSSAVSGSGFTRATTCSTSLSVGSSCAITGTFSPTAAQSYTGTVSVGFAETASQAITLTGSGYVALVADASSVRSWSNGNVASSCKGYIAPGAGYVYSGATGNGVYRIDVDGAGSLPAVNVYCDMTTDGGGWTVIQKRFNGAQDFYKTYAEYADGFGSATGEYWLGNKYLNALTTSASSLRVDLSRTNGDTGYAKYTAFSVGNVTSGYLLNVSGYSGSIGDSMTATHNGQRFSAKDLDQDSTTNHVCAVSFKGGWWYSNCHSANLNGLYLNGPHASYADGIEWSSWTGQYESMKTSEMKVRAN